MERRLISLWLAGLAPISLVGPPAWAEGCKLGVLADLPVTMEGTRASIPAQINGRDTRFWLDSGAFFSIMSQAKAAEFNLPLEPMPFWFSINGIGGSATTQLATVKSFGIVGQQLKHVQFLVGGTDVGNGLIGRNILALSDTEFDLADGVVKLIEPHGCEHTVMTYWTTGKNYSVVPLLPSENSADRGFKLTVTINGTKLEAALDTGAGTSLLRSSAARRAGIDLAAPGVVATMIGGFGRHYEKGWVVPVANITIGDEQTLHTHLDVFDDSADGGRNLPDLLLGADFIMAHHIYVARGQGRIYLTYTGGRPFRTSRDAAVARNDQSAPHPALPLPPGTHLIEAVANTAGDPKTAEGFARRGAARLSARDLPGALADLSEAIRQSPDNASYYANRARAWGQSGNSAAAQADIDRSLALAPNDADLLRVRARRRLVGKDRAGALADAEAAARVTPPGSLDSASVAELFIRLRQPARAIAMFDAVIAAHRDDAQLDTLLNGRCWARALANVDLDKALVDCNLAIRHNGPRPDWLDSRGLVYFRKGNYPLAVSDYDAALKLLPTMAWSLFMRGQARIAMGQHATGEADQAAARAIKPDISDEVAGYGIGVDKAKAS